MEKKYSFNLRGVTGSLFTFAFNCYILFSNINAAWFSTARVICFHLWFETVMFWSCLLVVCFKKVIKLWTSRCSRISRLDKQWKGTIISAVSLVPIFSIFLIGWKKWRDLFVYFDPNAINVSKFTYVWIKLQLKTNISDSKIWPSKLKMEMKY